MITSIYGILYKNNQIVVPDVLANSGGVTVSYFEWLQNLDNERWTEEEVNKRLKNKIVPALACVYDEALKQKCDLRTAAFIIAVKRLTAINS